MKKICISLLLSLMIAMSMNANDGVYFMSGNQLVPLVETQISVAKEILTISLKDDGTADVDVYYEFMNNGDEKDILMGFEADAPYNAGKPVSSDYKHPFMKDFSVVMNSQTLTYTNGIVKHGIENGLTELDRKKWLNYSETKNDNFPGMDNTLYNAKLDSVVDFSYVYKFNAHFKKGLNIVHHTYNYKMGYGVCMTFFLDYKLSPAIRWANHKIDDFTLRIKAENTAKHFILDCGITSEAELKAEAGRMKTRIVDFSFDDKKSYPEVSLRNGVLEWHKVNFVPTTELSLVSADRYLLDYSKEVKVNSWLGAFYDRSVNYNLEMIVQCIGKGNEQIDPRILRNLPYASRGYVFKSKDLQEYFNNQWWYMPDADWKPSSKDFTIKEKECIAKAEAIEKGKKVKRR